MVLFTLPIFHGKEHTVDLDSPTDTGMTENTTELYAKIDRLFEQLTDEEFQRLSTLNKTERTAAIDRLCFHPSKNCSCPSPSLWENINLTVHAS